MYVNNDHGSDDTVVLCIHGQRIPCRDEPRPVQHSRCFGCFEVVVIRPSISSIRVYSIPSGWALEMRSKGFALLLFCFVVVAFVC